MLQKHYQQLQKTIQTAEATGGFIGNKIPEEVTSKSKKQ